MGHYCGFIAVGKHFNCALGQRLMIIDGNDKTRFTIGDDVRNAARICRDHR